MKKQRTLKEKIAIGLIISGLSVYTGGFLGDLYYSRKHEQKLEEIKNSAGRLDLSNKELQIYQNNSKTWTGFALSGFLSTLIGIPLKYCSNRKN